MAISVYNSKSMCLSGCLNGSLSEGYKCLGTILLKVPWFY